MNILLDELPDHVMANGKTVPIETDFRPCLKSIMAFEDNDLTMEEKYGVMSMNLFPGCRQISPELFDQGIWFLNGGEAYDENRTGGTRVYSIGKDSNFIFAAFQQTHRIDLVTAHLHWWKFLALFSDLGSDTTFCQLVGLRKRLADGSATDTERRMAAEMREVVEIDPLDDSSIEEKELYDEFMRQLGQA